MVVLPLLCGVDASVRVCGSVGAQFFQNLEQITSFVRNQNETGVAWVQISLFIWGPQCNNNVTESEIGPRRCVLSCSSLKVDVIQIIHFLGVHDKKVIDGIFFSYFMVGLLLFIFLREREQRTLERCRKNDS